MRVGLFLAYWPWFTPQEQVDLAVLGDELGLDSVWISEAWGQDAVSVLGLLAGKTERIGLGTGLMQIPARQPTATAMAAASLDVLSDGRFRLGLGLSGPQVSEGWYGTAFSRPLARTREYVEIVRLALARRTVAYDGAEWALPLPADAPGATGLGRPLKLLAKPVQARIPVYLGSIGPRAVEQTGAIADGWLPFLLNPEQPEVLLDPLRRGAEHAGRTLGELDIAPVVPVAVAASDAQARDLTRPWLAFYLGAMGAKDKNFYVELAARYGHGDAARRCQELFLDGDRAGAAGALTDELIDAATIATTPDRLAARVARYDAAGADTLVIVPCGDKEAVVRAVAEAVGETVASGAGADRAPGAR
ncbi:LLM class F420-dependent oxidoreductase [Conexibacter woesei]|uniref:5,10-methylenetetrahydromethanopterin reductase n=1 Tax=Conexibacter woesei (strain DSM 14684 / CCUG 47730 / CIP 108061 / JCM 11494 / NBRC 100937 / ID131577) TaxID=469383 RepID=D3F226_CONWI|nr:LLM class F420-dependent oxidoreductase [Conexibacter woesei]ADB50201.1 5,10-methylenetetrahydromethanopterin reductase [Conexibacter woesei DSM 14684]